MEKTKHGICVYVENEFGVIQRLTNLFSARGMSIDSIHTTPIDVKENVSQVSFSLVENISKIELIQKLLMKIMIVQEVYHVDIPVTDSTNYTSFVFHIHQEYISKIKEIIQRYDLITFNVHSNEKIFCVTGINAVVDSFIKNTKDIQSFVAIKTFNPF